MLLARLGHRVLLVDRATFPSDTISTHLIHPPGLAALERWGPLDRVVGTGCPAIDTYAFDLGPFVIAGSPAGRASTSPTPRAARSWARSSPTPPQSRAPSSERDSPSRRSCSPAGRSSESWGTARTPGPPPPTPTPTPTPGSSSVRTDPLDRRKGNGRHQLRGEAEEQRLARVTAGVTRPEEFFGRMQERMEHQAPHAA
ncbi:hypothetical protein [Streptomyces sp. NPDC000410]|uniref:hypothetical protein n=1 Tax=Streptomyces sp. NPDC000410 TaxID=3154254 RepID=UPI00332C1E52